MKKRCEQCDSYFDPYEETVCDDCIDENEQERNKWLNSILAENKKLKEELAQLKKEAGANEK